MMIPGHLEIESVHGYCNAGCIMCSIEISRNKPKIMSNEEFATILIKFLPYVAEIRDVVIVGIGESLIDPGLIAKISWAKSNGFLVSLPTNASLLNEKMSKELLDSGLDEILFSIDSLEKETYEGIRRRLHFEDVMQNVHRFIKLRDESNYKTKIYVRIIEQELNSDEWNSFVAYWSNHLRRDKGDLILRFPRHNWADANQPIEKESGCPYIFDRMTINAYGDVQFCCIDTEAEFFDLGNVFKKDPIEIFNNGPFSKARDLMSNGQINKIKPCKYCDVPLKRLGRGSYEGIGLAK